jgi:hypothetical protein
VLAASIIRVMTLMEAASSSEMSVNFYQTTQRNNPEDSHFNFRPLEWMKRSYRAVIQQESNSVNYNEHFCVLQSSERPLKKLSVH